MVVVTSTLALSPCKFLCKPISPSLLYLRQICANPRRPSGTRAIGPHGVLPIKSYMENQNSLSGFANKVIGSLPVIGLVARVFRDEGGVERDIIDFAEFRRRVGKKSTFIDSQAIYEFQDPHGRAGDPSVGAGGLLKSDDILGGVARLRLSNDIEFVESAQTRARVALTGIGREPPSRARPGEGNRCPLLATSTSGPPMAREGKRKNKNRKRPKRKKEKKF